MPSDMSIPAKTRMTSFLTTQTTPLSFSVFKSAFYYILFLLFVNIAKSTPGVDL